MATVDIFPADGAAGLIAAVNSGAAGDVVNVFDDGGGDYLYNLGATVLAPKANMRIVGRTASGGGGAAVTATVKIVGAGANVVDILNVSGVVLQHLDLSGGVYNGTETSGQTGNVIRYHGLTGGNATIQFCKISGGPSAGIMGQCVGLLVEDCEITGNATLQRSGISAAAKVTRDVVFRRCYVHDNSYYGLWSDCQQPGGWTIEDCVITGQVASGIFNEITVGPSRITGNYIAGNNTSNGSGRGGMVVTSSTNVTISGNTFEGNLQRDLWLREDDRAGNATPADKDYINETASCQKGWRLDQIVVTGNYFAPGGVVQHQWDSGTIVTIDALADQTIANPNDTTAPQTGLTLSGNLAIAATPIALSDNFNDDNLDGAKWTTTVSAGASVAETGGQIVLDPGDGTSVRDSRIESATTYDLTGGSVTVELKQILNAVAGAQASFVLRDTVAGADVRFTVRCETDGGAVNLRRTGAGFGAESSQYDPVQHRFLRFRNQGGTLYWDTSPTALEGSWTALSSASAAGLTADLSAVEVWLSAQVYQITTGDPGTAVFDNLNAAEAPPTVEITAPDRSVLTIASGVALAFAASAIDAEDGDLSDDVVWTSSNAQDGIGGALGTGAQVEVDATGWSNGARTITATVTDSAGRSHSDSFTLRVGLTPAAFSAAHFAINSLGGLSNA